MFQFTPSALFLLTGLLVSVWLAFAIWSRRPGAGIKPFIVMAIGLMIWTSGAFGRLIVTSLFAKVFFTHVIYLGITIVPAAWLFFILDYTGRHRYVTKRNIMLASIQPILVQLALLTNPIHNAFAADFTIQTIDGLAIAVSNAGALFWIHAVYSYLLLLISCVILFRTLLRSPHAYRGQIIYLLIAVFSPWIANFVFLTKLSPLPVYIDPTPLAFVITVLAVGRSMYRFRLLDLVPIARDVIVENMDNAIVVIDNQNRIVDINLSATRLLNQSAKNVIGKTIRDILPRQQDLIHKFKDVENIETEIEMTISEKRYFFELLISSIKNRQGEVSGRIITLHDITTLKEANVALLRANQEAQEMTRLKSQFLATMSHELRTPLNAIIGYSELQLAGITGELNDKQQEYQKRVFVNANHLLSLINDVLDLSKIEAGRMELIQEPFALQNWVNEIVQQMSVLADEKDIAFKTQLDPQIPDILIGDAGRLKQVVINLISNAIKFTQDGHVKFTIQQSGKQQWSLIVEDTGIGIPPHKQETIFDEFHQIDNGSTRQYGGTGLGLAIVRKLVLNMGGIVRLQSTVGQGSQFTVLLPLISPAETQIPQINSIA